jgi:hypothetical protein
MGRPPIGKHAMSGAERQRRYLEKLLGGKSTVSSVTKQTKADEAKDREIAALKARIATLERERAQHEAHDREFVAAPPRKREKHRPSESLSTHTTTQGSGSNTQISKFIRHLGNANEAEAAAAARKLVSRLAASESDRHALAELWEKHCNEQARQRPPKPKPVDWPEVGRAIKTYAEGKTKVNLNSLAKAIYAKVPALNDNLEELRGDQIYGFIVGCLRRLGFVKRGEWTYERAASTAH